MYHPKRISNNREPLLFTAKKFRGAPEKMPLGNSQKYYYPQDKISESEGKGNMLNREAFHSLPSPLPTFTAGSQPKTILRIENRFKMGKTVELCKYDLSLD